MPATSCTNCGSAGYNISLANGNCGRYIGNKICEGTNQSAIDESDWDECPSCNGTGGTVRCEQCGGAGWLFVRGQTRESEE